MSKALKHSGPEFPKSPKPASYSGTQQSGAKKKPVNSSIFNKQNYLIMLIGLIILGIGFFLMAGGKSNDPNVFNTAEVYSFNRITLAPLLIIVGFLIEIYAIMEKTGPKSGIIFPSQLHIMDIFQATIISIVEGLTEYIPVSSTGHMIITEEFLSIPQDDFVKLYTIAIQLGAILAVVVLYYKKFFDFSRRQFYLKLITGVIPAIVLGFLLDDWIDALLDSRITVAVSLLLGGIILLFIDRAFDKPAAKTEEDVSYKNAFLIGLWQCLAMIPGVSRSAASIIGGMQQRLSRQEAAQFSFFLAVPTMLAATGYKLLKFFSEKGGFSGNQLYVLGLGNAVSFLVAIIAIRFFLSVLKKYGFRIWGIYRIALGLVLIALMYAGIIKY